MTRCVDAAVCAPIVGGSAPRPDASHELELDIAFTVSLMHDGIVPSEVKRGPQGKGGCQVFLSETYCVFLMWQQHV